MDNSREYFNKSRSHHKQYRRLMNERDKAEQRAKYHLNEAQYYDMLFREARRIEFSKFKSKILD